MRKRSMASVIRVQRKQNKSRMIGKTFSTLESNERRRNPWLGGVWFEDGRDEERKACIAEYHKETERMLKVNPNLKIVD